MIVEASAPGKLVLFGEYAVLFGAPAVVMAVDRRATVRLTPSRDRDWSVVAPGFAPVPARFQLSANGDVTWTHPAGEDLDRFILVERILESFARSELADVGSRRPFDAILDTRTFFEDLPHGRAKLGIGSSAALTTAFASAVALWAGVGDLLSPRRSWLSHLLELHRRFQGGRGSGIDLAASVIGGVVEYRLDDHGAVATAERLGLPDDLHMLLVWTGRSADTGEFLAQLFRELRGDGGAVTSAIQRLGKVARSGLEDLRIGSTSSFLTKVDGFCDALDELGGVVGLPILSPVHQRLRGLARDHAVHYKPSGAGGGDMGIAFAKNAGALRDLDSELADNGFQALRLSMDTGGLKVDRTDP